MTTNEIIICSIVYIVCIVIGILIGINKAYRVSDDFDNGK